MNSPEYLISTLTTIITNWHLYFKVVTILEPISITTKTRKNYKIQTLIIIDKNGKEIELSFFENLISRFSS